MTSTSLFQAQSDLPVLPVPTLESTLWGYLMSATALLSNEDLKTTSLHAINFLGDTQSSRGAKSIHSRLLEHKLKCTLAGGDRSWLIRWWNEVSYLAFREGLPINSSYFYMLAPNFVPNTEQAQKAAAIASELLSFRDMIFQGNLKPDRLGKIKLCMHMYRPLFHSYRVPNLPKDYVVQYSMAENEADAKTYKDLRNKWFQKRQYTVPEATLRSLPDGRILIEEYISEWFDDETPTIPELLDMNSMPTTAIFPPDYIVAMYAGQAFLIKTKVNNRSVSTADLSDAFESIIRQQSRRQVGRIGNIAAMTAMHRDEWADTYHSITQLDDSQLFLYIQSAAFVVCLESEKVTRTQELSELCLYGINRKLDLNVPTYNRWWDKTIQLVVWPKATVEVDAYNAQGHNTLKLPDTAPAALLFEHSLTDGHVTASMLHTIQSRVKAYKEKDIVESSVRLNAVNEIIAPLPLARNILHNMGSAISNATKFLEHTSRIQDTTAFVWTGYGKETIKKLKVSPDAWCQLALQVASARAMLKLRKSIESKTKRLPVHLLELQPTYEPVQMRKFRRGRTETVRSASPVALSFVRALQTWINSTNDSDMRTEAREKLYAAAAYHVNLCQKAASGSGIDRHLLGLRLIAKSDGTKLPEFFENPLHAQLLGGHWRVSTSNVSGNFVSNWGWGQVVPEGWGVAYSTVSSYGNDTLAFNIAARNDVPVPGGFGNLSRVARCSLLVEELCDALKDMHSLFSN